MQATSAMATGFACFSNTEIGFAEFKPITVCIGRNNTGKSRMVDFVELLASANVRKAEYAMRYTGLLDEDLLKNPFSKTSSGGSLGPSYGQFYDGFSHWNQIGKHFIGRQIEWTVPKNGQPTITRLEIPEQIALQYREAAKAAIEAHLRSIETPLAGKLVRRIAADRNIVTELAIDEMSVSPSGSGATNVFRRYITSSTLNEKLIQVDLLEALAEIFGPDGDFQRIEIREHDTALDQQAGGRHWEIYLGEPGKGLVPLSKSGSGLKTVILVLLNLLVIPNIEQKPKGQYLFAFEELENNLHPALLRRLLSYLLTYTLREKCHMFLTTHSNVALDFFGVVPESQIIHVKHNGVSATAKTIAAHFDRVNLLSELGSRPSDLLQANGVLWLEGPSDRTYLNHFIDLYSDGTLREGRDYQCAYYGGSILANTTFNSPDNANKSFVNLLRLNHNIAVICDGDRTSATGTGSRIKGRVQRIKQEVESLSSAFLWITDAKEIENYIPGLVWSTVYGVGGVPDPGKYDAFPSHASRATDFFQLHLSRKTFDKCDFAMRAVEYIRRDDISNRFDFDQNMVALVAKIREWNQ